MPQQNSWLIDSSAESKVGGASNDVSWSRTTMEEAASSPSPDDAKWFDDHPSALRSFEFITAAASGKAIAVFLDYDGTLSPIVDDPDQALMSEEMRACVKNVANTFPTAIVTGRRRDKVYQFVQLSELYYAGSHGMDIVGPAKEDGEPVSFQPASEFLPVINEVFKELTERTKGIEGSRVENNKYCITVHFRCVKDENRAELCEIVRNVLVNYEKLTLVKGRKVLEVRPVIDWNKGKALEFFLTALGMDKSSFPIYIGDDRTDEDAFKVLETLGVGCPILVSTVAKPSSAKFTLRDPNEVKTFLTRLVQWKLA